MKLVYSYSIQFILMFIIGITKKKPIRHLQIIILELYRWHAVLEYPLFCIFDNKLRLRLLFLVVLVGYYPIRVLLEVII